MAINSKIEWTEATWNPVTGCTKYSLGCKNCYAERMAKRLQAMGNPKYKNGFEVTLHPEVLELPLKWKKPMMIFVTSMSDLFHEKIPFEFIQEVFDVMNKAHWHTFQVLTKRAERLAELSNQLKWGKNIWVGVTVEHEQYIHRIELLKRVPAKVRFISMEPLLSDMPEVDFSGIHWIIVGGESGPGARPMKPEWVRHIRDMCQKQNIPFFFKQWGGVNKRKNGRILDGKIWNEMPKGVK